METRRKLFDLNNFLYRLDTALESDTDMIDDVVQEYKDFLSHSSYELKTKVFGYVCKHHLVLENQRLRSFVMACHR